ncbi:uncharacterized protein LOC124461680 [Drosophila willistoni]|uniref:uncharacterized protein LOC124461680 n=1 Tax=Drosophila willistoni TaxID=7260 RepID=UPI001F077F6E|nr:uncharacterized protein LOC124461680 [Drosophila willistoni]
MRVRRTAKDGLLLELRKCTADTTQSLKEAISQVLGEEAGVKALTRHKAVAIHGMDEKATPQELVAKLADQAKVEATSLRLRSFRSSFRNTMSAVVCAPEAVALKLLEVGRVRIGWDSRRIKELEAQPARCFRCLCVGHIAANCPSDTDRSNCCFRCGNPGHKSADCSAAVKCFLCAEMGLSPLNHIAGSRACPSSGAQRMQKDAK